MIGDQQQQLQQSKVALVHSRSIRNSRQLTLLQRTNQARLQATTVDHRLLKMLAPASAAAAALSRPRAPGDASAAGKAATPRLLALLRFLFTHKSGNASRSRRLLVLGAMSATGVSVMLHYVARGFCRTPLETAHLVVHVAVAVVKTAAQYVARGCRPLYPSWTFRFELLRAVMRCATELYGHRIADEVHAKRIRRISEVYGTSVGWLYTKFHGTRIEPVHVNGLEHVWIKSGSTSDRASKRRFVVVYYHGGGYAVLSPRMYIGFCNTLRTAIQDELRAHHSDLEHVQVDVFLANYRKIPEHPFPVPAQDAVAMYDYVVEQCGISPSQIIVAGDSAGGGLVMSTLLRLRERNEEHVLPLAAILCCPTVDLSVPEDECDAQMPHCVLSTSLIDACRDVYHLTRHDPSTWLDASPVHCDLRGLPPVFLQTATLDLLFPHSQRLMDKAARDGVRNWDVDVQEGVPHVFTVFPTPVLPHAMVGVQNMAHFAAKHFASSVSCDSASASEPSSTGTELAHGA